MKKWLAIILTVIALFCLALAACDRKDGQSTDSAVVTCTVTFKVDDGVYDTVTVEYGTAAILSKAEPVKMGHTFIGWDGSLENITTDTVVNALFTVNTYTITFMVENEVFYSISSISYGGKIEAPVTNPKKQADSINEYGFDGWYNGDVKWDFDTDTVEQNTVLTAGFKVTVTYTEEFLPSDI